MNHQTDRGTHSHAGIEHVNSAGVFGVEPIQRGSRAQTWDSLLPHESVECFQAAQQIWCLCRVYPVPDTDESTILDLDIKLLTSHHRKQLPSSGEPAGPLEERYGIGVHSESIWPPSRVS
ncbi:MAG: hypothetical protein QOF15_4440 [Mycobacterium sp.]|nr:hypothetical protein [Mycobacterium sp.]